MPTPILSILGTSQVEGGLMAVTVQLSEPATGPVTADLAIQAGTAIVGYSSGVYLSSNNGTIGTVAFAAGEQTQTIFLQMGQGDSLDEIDQSFFVQLSNPVGAAFVGASQTAEAVCWVLDNDGSGSDRAIAISSPVVVEQGAGQAVFTVSVSEPFATTTSFTYTTFDGSAVAGEDYVPKTGTITFQPGQTEATVTVALVNDTLPEAAESFGLSITGTAGGAASTATVLDVDDALPVLSIVGSTQIEGGLMAVTVQLSEPATGPVTANLAIQGGTAAVGYSNGVYFQSNNSTVGTVAFAPGEQTQTIFLDLGQVDSLDEIDQSFFVELSNPVGATFGGGNQTLEAINWVLDNDGTGTDRAIAVSSPTVDETGVAVFVIELSEPSDTPITVTYRTTPQTANGADFVSQSGSITFAAGQTTAEVRVAIKSDARVETNETFTLSIDGPLPSSIASPQGAIGVATITDYALRGTDAGERIDGTTSPERIEGLGGNDRLFGLGGNDALVGGDGNDTLSGGAGADRLEGGDGDDLHIVDTAGDFVVEASGEGIDTVSSAVTFALIANVENIDLTGTLAIDATGNGLGNLLRGNSGDNALRGLGGRDTINGRGGDDSLVGGRGSDILTGSAGADSFVFEAAADSGLGAARDRIADFAAGEDEIVLTAIDANAGAGGNQAFVLDQGGAFAAGEIRQTQLGADLLLELNTDADAAAEMSILLSGVTGPLAGSDFAL